MEEVHYGHGVGIEASHVAASLVLDFHALVHYQHVDIASFAQEHLGLLRVRRVRLVVHRHAEDLLVVLAGNDEEGGRVLLLGLAGEGELESNYRILRATVAPWQSDSIADIFDVRIDPLIFHWSSSEQQERTAHVPFGIFRNIASPVVTLSPYTFSNSARNVM